MSDTVQTLSLNIHLISIHLPEDLYKEGDDLRIGITTLPEHKKANFSLSATKIEHANHIFTINVSVPTSEVKDLPSNATRKITVSFRKKSVFSNPMIASAIIRAADFPQIKDKSDLVNGVLCGEIQKIDILEPINQQIKELKNCQDKGLVSNFQYTDHHTVTRKTIGYMEVQFSLCPPIEEEPPDLEQKSSKSCLTKTSSHSSSKNNILIKHKSSAKLSSLFSKNNNNADVSYHHFD